MKKKYLWLALFSVIVFSGCGIYSMSGSLPSHIKNVAVPLFENETVEVDIVDLVSDEIRSAIIKDGNMKIVAENDADAVVTGKIKDVFESADSFSKGEVAKQFKIQVFAEVTFFDIKKNKAIWEESNMEGWARYNADDPAAREGALKEALQMLAKDIIDKTVSGW